MNKTEKERLGKKIHFVLNKTIYRKLAIDEYIIDEYIQRVKHIAAVFNFSLDPH